jgi:dTDP-L-rhamnose 4-epimerase
MLIVAKNKGLNAFALRYQNVFGPGQSLSNPYTGILAIFSNLARKNKPINIFEDGLESRDFVYIDDVIESTLRSIQYQGTFVGSLNVGTGKAISVLEVASSIVDYFESQSELIISGDYRRGDIRHNIADMTISKKVLNYVPKTSFKEGLVAFLNWTLEEPAADSESYTGSLKELSKRNLLLKTKI